MELEYHFIILINHFEFFTAQNILCSFSALSPFKCVTLDENSKKAMFSDSYSRRYSEDNNVESSSILYFPHLFFSFHRAAEVVVPNAPMFGWRRV